MQDTTEFRTNRDLFSNHYLDHLLPESDPWVDIDEGTIEEAYAEIRRIYDDQRPRVEGMNEAPLEEEFIKPVLDALGHTYAVQEEVRDVRRYPDYAFFADEAVKRDAYDQQDGDETDFYRDAVAVGDAKRWGRKLDKLGGERRNFSNPSHQIYVYLQETPAEWAILTNGKCWRLYSAETSHKLDSYYEIDLEALFEGDHGSREFAYFYNFFRAGAFVADSGGESFLDRVYDRSVTFAEELGEDLEDNIYEAIRTLAEGFLTYPGNDLSAADLDLVHEGSLIYLYRLLFVFYAESEGRDLLDTQNQVYDHQYSLNTLKEEVHEELTTASTAYTYYNDDLWHRLENLFELIDQGSESQGIPRDELYVPAYNGGLFRTEVDAETSRAIRFLQEHTAGDAAVARVIDLLARREGEESGAGFVDYSSLDIRHLGSIYEGLLEYDLNVAGEPLVVVDGEYVPVAEADGAGGEAVEEGAVYLTTDKGERKATGSYYTPEYVVQYIVENTLDPLLDDIREELLATHEENFAEAFAERVFDLKILDPAMGSGHFLTNVVDHLANEIVDAQAKQGEEVGEDTVEESHDIHWARRQVVQRCVYGVDVNPLAVELAKVSLWLRTLAAEQPLAFLDHHLKTGNSLVGSDIEEIDELDTDASDGPNASLADFGAVRRGTIDHLMDVYEEFIAIENTDLADVKEMERRYREIERDDLRTRLVAMANVETAEDFGLDLPSGAYERMARALDSADEWAAVAETDWFRRAQALATEHDFLHWKLEFPEVFYEVDGSDRANPGFDAVVGNPPWLRFQKIPDSEREYQRAVFHSAKSKYDVYSVFIERLVEMLTRSGKLGYIIQNRFLAADYGESLKEVLVEKSNVKSILDFEDAPIFRGTTTYPLILLLDQESQPTFDYTHLRNATAEEVRVTLDRQDSAVTNISNEELDPTKAWIFPSEDEQLVINKLNKGSIKSSDVLEVSKSVSTGLKNAYLFEDKSLAEIPIETELLQPALDGADVDRYSPTDIGKYLLFPYITREDGSLSLINLDKYPLAEKHLREFETDLRKRRHYNKTIEDAGFSWYEFPHVKSDHDLPKVIFPDISTHPRCTYDTQGDVRTLTTAYGGVRKDNSIDVRYLCALFNSSSLRFVFELLSPKMTGGYYRYQPQYIGQLPIYIPEEYPDNTSELNGWSSYYEDYLESGSVNFAQFSESDLYELLCWNATRMRGYWKGVAAINLSLLDYLGTYADGETLGERYQPPAGLAESILAATAADYENLRIGTVSVAAEGSKLVVRATARYKPENPDAHETDRWGYMETEPQAAMEFVGLSDAERGLIEAFVPHAADEAGGFAGFRETATKTISPLDRLEALTLPKLADVEDGLERYLDAEERAAELNEKIEKTDDLIDQIVYELYGLTDEEIEIVEEAVGDD